MGNAIQSVCDWVILSHMVRCTSGSVFLKDGLDLDTNQFSRNFPLFFKHISKLLRRKGGSTEDYMQTDKEGGVVGSLSVNQLWGGGGEMRRQDYGHNESLLLNFQQLDQGCMCAEIHSVSISELPTGKSLMSSQTLLIGFSGYYLFILFIYLFGVLRHFQHCTGHITRVVGRAEETSIYSLLGFCTVNCRPTASNYQLSHLRPCWGSNPGLRGGRRECYHSATMAPSVVIKFSK